MATISAENNAATSLHVLRWTGGNFQINFEGKTDQETTRLNTQGLLMEGLRLLDESTRDGGGEAEPGPPETASASVPATASAPVSRKKDEEEDVLLDG